MQSGMISRGIWLDVADEILSIQGNLSDYILECIKGGKVIDHHTPPTQAINYYFAQSVLLSLRARVSQCHTASDLHAQLCELVSTEGMIKLVQDFMTTHEAKLQIEKAQHSKQPITNEFILSQNKTHMVQIFVRLYYALEQIACTAKRIHELIRHNESYGPQVFAETVSLQLKSCKDLLSHLTHDALVIQQSMKIDPLVEFNSHLVRLLHEKKVCQILVHDLLTLPFDARVNPDVSLVQKYPQIRELTGLQEIGVMLAGMAHNQPAGEDWNKAKASYIAAVQVLVDEVKAKVLVQSHQDAALCEAGLLNMSRQQVDVANTQSLDEFAQNLLQFNALSDIAVLQKLTEALSDSYKLCHGEETSLVMRATAKLNEVVSKIPGKRTSQKGPVIDPVTKLIERLFAKVEAVKKPYEDVLVSYEILKKLLQAQDQLPLAQEQLLRWQKANLQMTFIVDTAIQKLNEMHVRLQDVEKQQPNMVLDFIKRRWPEMTISFGSVGTAGGFGTALLSIFGAFTFPVTVTVAVVVVAGAATGVIVGAVKDMVTNPKSEKDMAIASLNTMAANAVQRVEQPPAQPASGGFFARLFSRAAPPESKPTSGAENNNNHSL